MQVEVNGQARPLPEPLSIAQLLNELELKTQHVAVEVNRELIPRAEHGQHTLSDGDQVEIVTLVGGG